MKHDAVQSEASVDEAIHRYGVVTSPGNIQAFRKMVPRRMWAEMARYLLYGERPCPLLDAILRNDLCGAIRARDDNGPEIIGIVEFLMRNAPDKCWGSDMEVEKWNGTENG